MEALFYVVPTLMIAFAVLGLATVSRRASRVRGAWDGGLTAEARCLRTYTTAGSGGSVSTSLHHVYEFRTRDGRGVRFEETGGPATTLEGDIVVVHYQPGRPEQATAHAPARGRLAAEQGCVFAFFGVFIAGCLTFMAVAHVIFSAAADVLP